MWVGGVQNPLAAREMGGRWRKERERKTTKEDKRKRNRVVQGVESVNERVYIATNMNNAFDQMSAFCKQEYCKLTKTREKRERETWG